MRSILEFAQAAAGQLWWWLRQVSGDAAYENYLSWACRAQAARQRTALRAGRPWQAKPGPVPHADRGRPEVLSPEGFYLESLEHRYARISRCC